MDDGRNNTDLEIGDLRSHLNDMYGIKLPEGLLFSSGKKVFLYTGRDIFQVGRRGLYIGTLDAGRFRPSLYASQMATKCIIDIESNAASDWMSGLDIPIPKDIEASSLGYFAIIRYKKYIIGIGKPKETRIINNLPKNARLPLGRKV